jgi:hypothetical protein
MAVFLNSTPQEDGAIITGSVSVYGDASASNVVALREDSQTEPTYVQIGTGGQYVAILTKAGTYLEAGDTGYTFRWKFWAQGTGTLELRQDTDPSWGYSMPTPGIGNLAVSSVGWTLYHVDADPIDLTAFLAYDGVRLGMIGTSGTVSIQTVQLECVPDGTGTTGWWVDDTNSYDFGEMEATARSRNALGTDDEYVLTNRQDAWDLAVAEVTGASNPTADPSPSLAFPNPPFITGNSWYLAGEVLFIDPVPYGAQFSLGISKMWVDTEVGSAPVPHGTDGVDFIRIPAYTVSDEWPYIRSAANRSNPPTSFANWITPNAVYSANNGSSTGDYTATNNAIGMWVIEEEGNSDLPVSWSPTEDPNWIVTPSTPGTVTESVALPSSGHFVAYLMPMVVYDGGAYEPVLPDPGADVSSQMGASLVFQSDAEAGFGAPLLYTLTFDPFSVWDPSATPPADPASWVRNVQRNDGLGISNWRWRSYVTINVRVVGITFSGFGSNQSIRWRAIR